MGGTGGAGTAAFLSYGALARIYESKPVKNATLRLANTLKGTSKFEQNINALNKTIMAISQGDKPPE